VGTVRTVSHQTVKYRWFWSREKVGRGRGRQNGDGDGYDEDGRAHQTGPHRSAMHRLSSMSSLRRLPLVRHGVRAHTRADAPPADLGGSRHEISASGDEG